MLVGKELQVLAESRSLWLMFVVSSVLVGHAFLDALQFYAEASGSGGGPAALSQSLSPLDGLVVPVFGAFDLMATLVFPFVVIRLFAVERETGELALSLQQPVPFWLLVAAKAVALSLAWMAALIPAGVALAIWKAHGAHLHEAETMVVVGGYLLRGALTIGIGAAACSITGSASSAAIIALTITLGTWMLDYIAAAKGGVVAVLSTYTPDAALRSFERGELRLSAVLVLGMLVVAGLTLWGSSAQTGRSRRWRLRAAAGTLALAMVLCAGVAVWKQSWDVSEDRRNSFSSADERVLTRIREPLTVTVHLAAEDPRLTDLEHGVLFKLRRTVHQLHVEYAAKSRSGLFESSGSSYGEIWLDAAGRRVVTRSVAEPVVLDAVYEVLHIVPPAAESNAYPGYPAHVESAIAPWLFFALIPLGIVLLWWRVHVRQVDFPTALTS
ncbi:MAG: hypothetical protein JWM95_947 [Gemmatimonadetes bacterium]|nr:hypothetical protein [Gemmatimonadota bacterium]